MANQPSSLDELQAAIQLTKMLELEPMDLGLLCRLHRAKKGLKASDAAKKIGITRQLLAEVEDEGHVPGDSKLKAIADYYGDGFKFGLGVLGIQLPKDNPQG